MTARQFRGERRDPLIPAPVLADGEQQAIVFVAIRFKVGAEGKHGLGQDLLRTEQENDQQTSNASVAVQKRMDSLKLVVTPNNHADA